jgi:hypothetical protein
MIHEGKFLPLAARDDVLKSDVFNHGKIDHAKCFDYFNGEPL